MQPLLKVRRDKQFKENQTTNHLSVCTQRKSNPLGAKAMSWCVYFNGKPINREFDTGRDHNGWVVVVRDSIFEVEGFPNLEVRKQRQFRNLYVFWFVVMGLTLLLKAYDAIKWRKNIKEQPGQMHRNVQIIWVVL